MSLKLTLQGMGSTDAEFVVSSKVSRTHEDKMHRLNSLQSCLASTSWCFESSPLDFNHWFEGFLYDFHPVWSCQSWREPFIVDDCAWEHMASVTNRGPVSRR